MAPPLTPSHHFRLRFYSATLRVIRQLAEALGSVESTFDRFPFLAGYAKELLSEGLKTQPILRNPLEASARWDAEIEKREAGVSVHLPIRELSRWGKLTGDAVAALFVTGLVEEDVRFGIVFDLLQGTEGRQRPTYGLLNSWFGARPVRELNALGVFQVSATDAPRSSQICAIPSLVWDALKGETTERLAPWVYFRAWNTLPDLGDLIALDEVRDRIGSPRFLLDGDAALALIIRGPHNNGRKTLLSCMAKVAQKNVLEILLPGKADDERWKHAALLATLLDAMPICAFDLAPGETADLAGLDDYSGPLGIVLGEMGGIEGKVTERATTIALEMPSPELRRGHWRQALGDRVGDLDTIGSRFRMTGGNIRRAAKLAISYASLEGRGRIDCSHVRQASRALNRQALDKLAKRVEVAGDWSHLAAAPEIVAELDHLETRCRFRERLASQVSPALHRGLNAGVRALFSGPSGTGKTLAAQLLASRLEMDLYRLDLSTVVNKYIGETEKNLDQLFSRAEELDVILLLDEGDALLTERTGVQSSNDRYANLETNYLLQRVESFEGILVVTTNAADRIDKAFKRRMDVVVEFRAPEASERWAIWQMHLPAAHNVDEALLTSVSFRCALSGGQIRNAALHASALALNSGGAVQSSHIESAVQREYRKMGAICPLRSVMTGTPAH